MQSPTHNTAGILVLNSDPDSYFFTGCAEQAQNLFWNLIKIKSPQQANPGKLSWKAPRIIIGNFPFQLQYIIEYWFLVNMKRNTLWNNNISYCNSNTGPIVSNLFLVLPSIPNISEPFELLLALLSVVIFNADLKDDISDKLVSFDEVILLDLRSTVVYGGFNDSRWLILWTWNGSFDLFRTITNNTLLNRFEILKLLVSCYMGIVHGCITNYNMHTLFSSMWERA